MKILLIIIVTLIIIIIRIIILLYKKRPKPDINPSHPDMFYYGNYGECHRPFVALKHHCTHTGDKTLQVINGFASYEELQTICSDCGHILNPEIHH